jgi:excisionase family DNA binding protein
MAKKKVSNKEVEVDLAVAYRTPNAARVLNVSKRALQRLIQTKELKSFRVGKMRLVRRKAIEDFCAERENAQAS